MFNRGMLLLLVAGSALAQSQIAAPRIWNDRDLAEWATPLATLKIRPGHLSEKEYYSVPVAEWVRSYPVYFPGREPEGYWQMLQSKKPEPLIAPGSRTEVEWVEAGRRAFEEMDVPGFRTSNPKFIAKIRSAAEYAKLGGHAQKDGTVFGWRWVPTSKGLMLSISECSGCHTRIMSDGSRVYGAQGNDPGDDLFFEVLQPANEVLLPGDSQALAIWRQFGVPWAANDITRSDQIDAVAGDRGIGQEQSTGDDRAIQRQPVASHPDHRSDRYQRPEVSGLQRHPSSARARGRGALRRAGGLLRQRRFRTAPRPHRKQRIPPNRVPDELAFSLAKYIYSLEPPKNPNANNPRAAAGRKVFEREGCGGCHSAPLYTNNKLTLAKGWTPPQDHPYRADMLLFSVGTEAAAALETRKGTGLYKVPSLRGLWYRSLLSHDGSAASLEEWFDPARLGDSYVPKGFKGYQVEHRAVPGHEYGLKLGQDDKTSLLAFLRTL